MSLALFFINFEFSITMEPPYSPVLQIAPPWAAVFALNSQPFITVVPLFNNAPPFPDATLLINVQLFKVK